MRWYSPGLPAIETASFHGTKRSHRLFTALSRDLASDISAHRHTWDCDTRTGPNAGHSNGNIENWTPSPASNLSCDSTSRNASVPMRELAKSWSWKDTVGRDRIGFAATKRKFFDAQPTNFACRVVLA